VELSVRYFAVLNGDDVVGLVRFDRDHVMTSRFQRAEQDWVDDLSDMDIVTGRNFDARVVDEAEADRIRTEVLAPQPPAADSRSADGSARGPVIDKIIIDTLASDIRMKRITPEDALALMKANKVLVWPEVPAPTTWGEMEDRGANTSGIHHELAAIGAAALSDQFSAEVARLRREGLTIE
jgi:hypothetical protein